jgi:hypothetical protein
MEGGRVISFVQPHLCTDCSSPRVFRSGRGWGSLVGCCLGVARVFRPAVRHINMSVNMLTLLSELQRSNVAVI